MFREGAVRGGYDDFSGVAAVSNRREVKASTATTKPSPRRNHLKPSRIATLTNVTGATLTAQTLSISTAYAEQLYDVYHCIGSIASMGSRKNGYSAFGPSAFSSCSCSPLPRKTRSHLLRAAKRCLVMPARREIRRTVGPQPAF